MHLRRLSRAGWLAAVSVLALGCAAAGDEDDFVQAGEHSYFNQVDCAPWGTLSDGSSGALAHAMRLGLAAYLPPELTRCARRPAELRDGGLWQDFGAVQVVVSQTSEGFRMQLSEPKGRSLEARFLQATERFQGLPQRLVMDIEVGYQEAAKAFQPTIARWLALAPGAVFRQWESLGHRYLFVEPGAAWAIGARPGFNGNGVGPPNAVVGYADCDYNPRSPGCIHASGNAQLYGAQPVPLGASFETDYSIGFSPRLEPKYARQMAFLTQKQQRRLLLMMQGLTLAEMAGREGISQGSASSAVRQALANLGFVTTSAVNLPLRQAFSTMIGADFALIAKRLESNPALIFATRKRNEVQLSEADFRLAHWKAQDLELRDIARRFQTDAQNVTAHLVDLRRRLELPVSGNITREQDVQMLMRMHDLALPHLPQPLAGDAVMPADVGGAQEMLPAETLQHDINRALASETVSEFLALTRGRSAHALLGDVVGELVEQRGVVSQAYRNAVISRDPQGRFTALPVGDQLLDALPAAGQQSPDPRDYAGSLPHVVRTAIRSADAASLTLKYWARDFEPWISAWSELLGTAFEGGVTEAYGHLFYLKGPVALVHCGYNPYSPGCSCNDSAVKPLPRQAVSELSQLLAPFANYLAQKPKYAVALPHVAFGFPTAHWAALLGVEQSSDVGNFARWMAESLGFSGRHDLVQAFHQLSFRNVLPGLYQAGLKRLTLTLDDVQVLVALSHPKAERGRLDKRTKTRISRLSEQVGAGGFPNTRLMVMAHYLTKTCNPRARGREGGLLSGRGIVEPWHVRLDARAAPVYGFSPRRGALTRRGQVTQGQSAIAWSTWTASTDGSELYVLIGSLADPQFVKLEHVRLDAPANHLAPPGVVPTLGSALCPIYGWGRNGRLIRNATTGWNTQVLASTAEGAYVYAKTESSMGLAPAGCIQ